jgi:hypothetical protein
MMANADVVEAEVTQDILGLLDHPEFMWGHGLAIRNPRAKASHLGLVGGRQTELGGKRSDIGFGQAGFLERGAGLELRGSFSAGPEATDTAGVLAIGDDSHAFSLGQRGKLGEQLVLAEIAVFSGLAT